MAEEEKAVPTAEKEVESKVAEEDEEASGAVSDAETEVTERTTTTIATERTVAAPPPPAPAPVEEEEGPKKEQEVVEEEVAASKSKSSSGTSTPEGDNASPPDSPGSTNNKFYSLSRSIQTTIEELNDATKQIEKINDKILFQASTISSQEESVLMKKVAEVVKTTNMKARDASREIRQLRVETVKPTVIGSISEVKDESEKSAEELAEESRDVGDKENICKTVTRSFTDELLLYQSAIQEFKSELKERLTKKIQSIRSGASEDYVDMSIRSESSRYALFRDIMAANENMTEEEAKELKDHIAERYLIIAELSDATGETNKIFLTLASVATQSPAETLSSDEEASSRGGTTAPKSRFGRGGSFKDASTGSGGDGGGRGSIIDDLLGSRTRPPADGAPAASPAPDTSSKTTEPTAGTAKSEEKFKKKNRLFNFMQRHRRTPSESERRKRLNFGDGPRKRRNRATRWMAMFLLATVGLAAIVGLVMLH